MGISKRDDLHHTFADYLVWSRTHGDELIDGTAYIREPPSPSYGHQSMVAELARQLMNQLVGTPWQLLFAPLDVRLPRSNESDDEIDTVVQPDLFITCEINRLSKRGLRGAPRWLAEVLSPSTASYDRAVKIPVYERAGVPEVWLVNPRRRSLAVYRLVDGRYQPPTILNLSGRTRLTAVPGVSVDWDQVNATALNADDQS